MEKCDENCTCGSSDNKIFATQRGYGEFKDGWEFPGGKIEEGETSEQALVREIKEELDTDIKVGKLIDTIEYDYLLESNFYIQRKNLIFLLIYIKKQIQ